MALICTAHAVIGVEIDKDKLETTVTKRGCQHPRPKGGNHCSICGSPVEKEIVVLIQACEPRDAEVHKIQKVAGLAAYYHLPTGRMFVGVHAQSRAHNNPPLDPEVTRVHDDLRHQVRSALEPIGLWDEAKFGLWTMVEPIW